MFRAAAQVVARLGEQTTRNALLSTFPLGHSRSCAQENPPATGMPIRRPLATRRPLARRLRTTQRTDRADSTDRADRARRAPARATR